MGEAAQIERGSIENEAIAGAPLVVGHRDPERGWLVRMLAGGLTFDMTREDARALRDDVQIVLDAFAGKFGN